MESLKLVSRFCARKKVQREAATGEPTPKRRAQAEAAQMEKNPGTPNLPPTPPKEEQSCKNLPNPQHKPQPRGQPRKQPNPMRKPPNLAKQSKPNMTDPCFIVKTKLSPRIVNFTV